MYSVVLMLAVAGAEPVPQGILFNRGAGCGGAQSTASGCGGQGGVFAGRGQRHGLLYRLRSGGQAAVLVESGPVRVKVGPTAGFKRMPNGLKVAAPISYLQVGDHVKHAANAAGEFPAGTGVITSAVPWNTADGFSYQVRCDKTGKVLPANFKSSELEKVPDK